jgi:hypothetical protein
MTDYFTYCVVGRILIYIIQKASLSYLPLIKSDKWKGFLTQLFGCDLCLGVWIYTLLAWFLNVNVLYEYVYVPVISEIITGMITSFLVWLVRNGWSSQFQIVWANHQE